MLSIIVGYILRSYLPPSTPLPTLYLLPLVLSFLGPFSGFLASLVKRAGGKVRGRGGSRRDGWMGATRRLERSDS